jgi:hypothetical protein
MGNQCGGGLMCGDNETAEMKALKMTNLIKIQSVYRSYQARKRKQSIKEEKIHELFCKWYNISKSI